MFIYISFFHMIHLIKICAKFVSRMLIMIASEKQLAERHPVEKVWLQAIRLTAVKVRWRHWKKVFYFTKDVSAWVKDA